MPVSFHKMTGSGNDFVVLDGRETSLDLWPPARIREMCDRRSGVGADGLVLLSPEADGAVRMIYFNADGSRAELCGNAALCSTRLAATLGMANDAVLRLHTDSGVIDSRCVGPGWAAEIRLPDVEVPEPVEAVPLGPGERRMARITVGVPHLVVLVDDPDAVNVVDRGARLRNHAVFQPGGVNVNFVGRARGAQDAAWTMRTYERGVEGETLACGTGTVAVAGSLAGWGLDRLPVRIVSRGGGVFTVAGAAEGGRVTEPWLCGEGRLVFSGHMR
jgi:diaminopimelate epimerase